MSLIHVKKKILNCSQLPGGQILVVFVYVIGHIFSLYILYNGKQRNDCKAVDFKSMTGGRVWEQKWVSDNCSVTSEPASVLIMSKPQIIISVIILPSCKVSGLENIWAFRQN